VAAKTGKKRGDEALLLGLASGLSVPLAAQAAGLSERTAYRRLEDPAFRARVEEMRDEMVSRTIGRLVALGELTVSALESLLGSPDPTIRLGAVRVSLDRMFKAVETNVLAQRVAECERLLAQSKARKK
jgi:hypothetical protein